MLNYQTLEQATESTIEALSQVPGFATQLYSADRIAQFVEQIFSFVFDEYRIPEYCEWLNTTLDGTSGSPVGGSDPSNDVSRIKRFEDILHIYRRGSNTPLRRFPYLGRNLNDVSGGTARYYDYNSITGKVFKVVPIASTGTIDIRAKIRPDDFITTTVIKLDPIILVNGAAWLYAEDDGTNPAQASKFQTLFERKLNQKAEQWDQGEIELTPGSSTLNEKWEEC